MKYKTFPIYSHSFLFSTTHSEGKASAAVLPAIPPPLLPHTEDLDLK